MINSPKVKWLLVDIGDVLLLKTTDTSFGTLLADELGIDLELAQEVNKAHYTTMDAKFIPEDEFVTSLKSNLGYEAPQDVFAYFERAYRKQTRPNFELLRCLDGARASGIKTAVLSNTIAIYRDVQRRYGISKEGGFDPIIYSWEVEKLKPNKDFFELAIEKLGALPEEIVFIDDKIEHLRTAQGLGTRTVLFDNTENVVQQIRELIF